MIITRNIVLFTAGGSLPVYNLFIVKWRGCAALRLLPLSLEPGLRGFTKTPLQHRDNSYPHIDCNNLFPHRVYNQNLILQRVNRSYL